MTRSSARRGKGGVRRRVGRVLDEARRGEDGAVPSEGRDATARSEGRRARREKGGFGEGGGLSGEERLDRFPLAGLRGRVGHGTSAEASQKGGDKGKPKRTRGRNAGDEELSGAASALRRDRRHDRAGAAAAAAQMHEWACEDKPRREEEEEKAYELL